MAFRNKQKLIVGIDYGTTYSGLSFALSNASDFKDIRPWTKYPGASSHHAEMAVKAPTRVAFACENADLAEDAWGYQVEPDMKAYALTKLLLDKETLQSEYDDPELATSISRGDEFMIPTGESALTVATRFLKGMYDMFEKTAIEMLGEDGFNDMPIDYWLTVPATWSEKAKLLTKCAALDAGFASKEMDRIMLIPEPEAAAHAALKSGLHTLANFVETGNNVMVCDCGGGTVDITSYEIQRTHPTLRLREVAVGAAGKCGGTFVDRNFFKLMVERFGEAFTSLGVDQIGPASAFMDQFELKKKDFSMKNPSRRPHRLVLPMPSLRLTPEIQKYYEKRSSSVLLRSEDFKILFDPVIDKIEQLVHDQASEVEQREGSSISTMILVGGFGSSPYLNERLESWCQQRNIRLKTPWTGGWSAIVCGAVLRGLEGSIVKEKKCRRHYGYAHSRRYSPSTHAGYDRLKRFTHYNIFDQADYLSGFMSWSMGKGTVIHSCTEIERYLSVQVSECSVFNGSMYLYSCSLDDGPPTIENDQGIEKVGNVKYSIPLDLLDLDKTQSLVDEDGTTWYNLTYTLRTRLDDDSGHLVFSIHYDGKEVGKAGIDITSS
ncbi:unnamed protein product [Clonostachys rosea]|uniref:Actin-like ATPase domain-containing protein n=1 Tax=Bionectria ochroleuca TaxID=29856 RepID=A0ABY6UIJ1_BIOOC|nr:unnamed protein product [Clonostachys rosea]